MTTKVMLEVESDVMLEARLKKAQARRKLCKLAQGAVLLAAVLLLMSGFTSSGTSNNWTAAQMQAHEIAETARAMADARPDEAAEIIATAQKVWWAEETARIEAETEIETENEAEAAPEGVATVTTRERAEGTVIIPEDPIPEADFEAAPERSLEVASEGDFGVILDDGSETTPEIVDLWNGLLPYEVTYGAVDEFDATVLAKIAHAEARGVSNLAEQANIMWTVLNRVDAWGGAIYSVATAPYQFAYRAYESTVDDYGRDMMDLARDVLYRWQLEKAGVVNVGRTLPADYLWYTGDGWHNYFRLTSYGWGEIEVLPSPY